MILKQDGSVWATGYNLYGQLGDGETSNKNVFVPVIFESVKVIAAGAFHSMVVKQDGSIWATGSNHNGQLGDGSKKSRNRFILVAPIAAGAGPGHVLLSLSHLNATTHSTVPFANATKTSDMSVITTEAKRNGNNRVTSRISFDLLYFMRF